MSFPLFGVLTMIWNVIGGLRKQRQHKALQYELHVNNRISIDAKLEKYRPAFAQVRKELKEDLDYLSNEAMKALHEIIRTFDCFDIENGKRFYLRHAVYKCVELLFLANRRQLGQQSGQFMFNAFQKIIFMEDYLKCRAEPSYLKDFWQPIEDRFRRDRAFTESDLHNDDAFCELFKAITEQFDSSREIEFIQMVQEHFANFNGYFNEIKPRLENGIRALQEILEENEADEVSIDESPRLAVALYRELAAFDTLRIL